MDTLINRKKMIRLRKEEYLKIKRGEQTQKQDESLEERKEENLDTLPKGNF